MKLASLKCFNSSLRSIVHLSEVEEPSKLMRKIVLWQEGAIQS